MRVRLFQIEIMVTRSCKREGGKRTKEIESEQKRIRKGGRERETERREHARVRALKTTQRAHATTMNVWMSE